MKKTLCRAHLTGVPPGARRFYSPGCPFCEQKLKRGMVYITDPLQPLSLREQCRREGLRDFHPAAQAAYRRGH